MAAEKYKGGSLANVAFATPAFYVSLSALCASKTFATAPDLRDPEPCGEVIFLGDQDVRCSWFSAFASGQGGKFRGDRSMYS